MGYFDNKKVAHDIVPKVKDWGLAGITLHGRSRQQRYSRLAEWDYIKSCADASSVPLIGNGDIFSYHDYAKNVEGTGVATCMVARGALIKPWVGPHRHCSPRHPRRFEPSFLESNAIL